MSEVQEPIHDGELIKFGEDETAVSKYSEDDYALASKAGSYLPRLQLMTSNSKECKKTDGFPINHYALVSGKNLTDLGTEVDVLVVEWRPKAIEMGDSIIIENDPKSDEFKRIQAKADEKNSNCMFGPEYLVFIPGLKEWATFFMGSKSARNESGNMKTRLRKAATIKSQELSNKSYEWQAPSVVSCSTPFEVPPQEDIMEQRETFLNPPEPEVTKDTDEDSRER